MNICSLSLALLVFGYTASTSAGEHGCASMQTTIRAANPGKYEAITDARNWKNPFLVVSANGVTIIDSKQERQFVPVEALPTALSKMPVSEWPYGLVVAMQESGVVPATTRSEITDNVNHVRKLLSECSIRVESWPSA